MKTKIWITGTIIGLSLGMMACGGPSEEKIEQAQIKYNELVKVHNKTVEAHSEVEDSYLDEDLMVLSEQVNAMRDYNLAELTEEGIDVIIEEMSSAIQKYEANIVLLAEKKQQEADAVVIDIPITIHNLTEFEWKELYLFPANGAQGGNVLNDMVSMGVGESLTGLYAYKDIEAKPWKMVLSDDAETVWEYIIAIDELDESGKVFFLQYDSENESVILEDSDLTADDADAETDTEEGAEAEPLEENT